jgi:hypothetical protein
MNIYTRVHDVHIMEILKQLDRLEFDFFDHTIPFYTCTSCVGVPADVLGTVKDTDKKAWYDQNIEFWLYRYYMYRLYAIYRVSPCTYTYL